MKKIKVIALFWVSVFSLVLILFAPLFPRDIKFLIPIISVFVIGFCIGIIVTVGESSKEAKRLCKHFGISLEMFRDFERNYKNQEKD